ncbi:MAG: hypothetical protein EBE86_001890 [Hormoscilla sp. GUM202]|nr:hypothetical protein [Hormoscilla sp. GUM202]
MSLARALPHVYLFVNYFYSDQALGKLAEAHAQQDPTFNSTIGYTRLSAAEAIAQLKELFFPGEQLPSVSTMAEVLNGMGYRLRQW